PDAGPPVSITVTRHGEAVPGRTIYFQDASSRLVLETKTDATGSASAIMPPGGFVTRVGTTGLNDALLTVSGVEPGHQISVSENDFTPITLTEIVPADPTPGVAYLHVISGCFFGGPELAAPASGTISTTGPHYDCGPQADFLVQGHGSVYEYPTLSYLLVQG